MSDLAAATAGANERSATAKALLDRARALLPGIAARAPACEEGRRLPEETERHFFSRRRVLSRASAVPLWRAGTGLWHPDRSRRGDRPWLRIGRMAPWDYRGAVPPRARPIDENVRSAVEQLMPLLGARGLIAGDPVQRAWRDVHAVGQHIGLVWDVQAGLYGSVALGYPCPDPKL